MKLTEIKQISPSLFLISLSEILEKKYNYVFDPVKTVDLHALHASPKSLKQVDEVPLIVKLTVNYSPENKKWLAIPPFGKGKKQEVYATAHIMVKAAGGEVTYTISVNVNARERGTFGYSYETVKEDAASGKGRINLKENTKEAAEEFHSVVKKLCDEAIASAKE